MPWKYSDEYYREYTRTTWNESAVGYTGFMRALEPFRAALIDRLDPHEGERILDLGTGPGEPAMSVAERVGSRGHVAGVDLSEKMVAMAREAADRRGLRNLEFQAMDCTSLSYPSNQFDALVCSFGFQIFTDPEKAAREAHRVLRAEGRICASVWSTGDRVPFLHAIIGPMLEHAEPDESGYLPTPYETGGPGEMVAFLEAAGFRNGAEERVEHTVRLRSAEEYLDLLLKGTPIGHSLSEEDAAVQAEVLRKTRENLGRWKVDGGYALPAECVIVRAYK